MRCKLTRLAPASEGESLPFVLPPEPDADPLWPGASPECSGELPAWPRAEPPCPGLPPESPGAEPPCPGLPPESPGAVPANPGAAETAIRAAAGIAGGMLMPLNCEIEPNTPWVTDEPAPAGGPALWLLDSASALAFGNHSVPATVRTIKTRFMDPPFAGIAKQCSTHGRDSSHLNRIAYLVEDEIEDHQHEFRNAEQPFHEIFTHDRSASKKLWI